MKAFRIDVARCNGCYACQIACKDEHCGNDWTPYAKPQPDTGQFWGKLHETVRGKVPHVKMSYVFVPCQHCIDAPCIAACHIEGALFTRNDGLVIIDPKKCTGCQNCLDACPYNVIFYNASLHLAQKCTGCAHLLDVKDWKTTRCADNCPTEAIKFGEESDLDLNSTEILHPEYQLMTKVHYKNLPKKFIAGTVFDPGSNEVVIGAKCTLTGDGNTFTATTDNFGDFWFKDLNISEYSLKIEKDTKVKSIPAIDTIKDIGLGYIALS